jgi:hypothetical protein
MRVQKRRTKRAKGLCPDLVLIRSPACFCLYRKLGTVDVDHIALKLNAKRAHRLLPEQREHVHLQTVSLCTRHKAQALHGAVRTLCFSGFQICEIMSVSKQFELERLVALSICPVLVLMCPACSRRSGCAAGAALRSAHDYVWTSAWNGECS